MIEEVRARVGQEVNSRGLSKSEQTYFHVLKHCATVKRLLNFTAISRLGSSEIKLHWLAASRVKLTPDLLFLVLRYFS